MYIEKVLDKYRLSSVTFKATIWYTISNIMQKLAAFLVIPFLTRMLSTANYGLYSVFLSWVDIFEIFATFKIYNNGYIAGLVKNSSDQKNYTSTIQITVFFITIFFCIVCCAFIDRISLMIKLPNKYIYYMFLSFFASSTVGIWTAKQRVNNRYKLMVLVTLLYSVFSPFVSIYFGYRSTDRLNTIILVRLTVQFILSIPLFMNNLFGGKKCLTVRYCKEALTYNIPLIPYYLSMVILNSSDRIMINEIVGETEAGIYSVAYSLSMTIFVFVGALNLSLQPWIFNKLKLNNSIGVRKVISLATIFIAFLNMIILIISPELITLVSSNKYIQAIWTMPPIINSLLLIFVYQQFLNINFYFGENRTILFASLTAAVLNLILNYYSIKIFGYIAAGYTTFICYFVIYILYYISMKNICINNNINYKNYFNMPIISTIIAGSILLSIVILLIYPYPITRYALVLALLIYAIINNKKFFDLINKLGVIRGD